MENRATNNQENWIKWNPCKISEGTFIVIDFVINIEGTKIILNDDDSIIEVLFDGVTPLVRNSIEGIRMRTWGEVQKKYNDKYFFRNWFLYKVENSKLSCWAVEESCGFYNLEELTHFCIVTGQEIVDILATFEPTISIKLKKEGALTDL